MTAVLSPHEITVRDALADAPLGGYPLLEAAFAWHERRPPGWHEARPISGRYAPLVETGVPQAASRLARLLIPMVWANVTPTLGRWHVEVPVCAYHRTTRALTAAWRLRSELVKDAEAALAVWRMALLIADYDRYPGRLTVTTSSHAVASLLAVSAARLGLVPSVTGRKADPTVMIDRRHNVGVLLRRATARTVA